MFALGLFQCFSEGWLHKWKTLQYPASICECEKLSEDEVEVTLCCDELADTIFDYGYCMDQIFNTDEIGLNYKMWPSQTLVAKADRETPGVKKCQEHMTVLTCANASG